MASFNRVVLIGNLTRDVELRTLPGGKSVGKMSIAINRRWRSEAGEQKEEVTFVEIDMFGKTAENSAEYLRKGSSCLVEGRLKLDQWDDKQTGQKRQKLGVVAESVQFLDKAEGGARSSRPASSAPAPGGPPHEGDDVPF